MSKPEVTIKRKYRGALRVVELQAEVERLAAAVPKDRGELPFLARCAESAKKWDAWHDAWLRVHQALHELWGVSPTRAHAVAKKFGLGDPTPHGIHLSPFDKLKYRRGEAPCGKRITGYRAYLKRYCKRMAGHEGFCSESSGY